MGTLRGPWQGLLAPPGVPGREAAVCEAKLGVCVSCGLTAPPPAGSWVLKASHVVRAPPLPPHLHCWRVPRCLPWSLLASHKNRLEAMQGCIWGVIKASGDLEGRTPVTEALLGDGHWVAQPPKGCEGPGSVPLFHAAAPFAWFWYLTQTLTSRT